MTVNCVKCGRVVKDGSGAKVNFDFASKRQVDWHGVLCTSCAHAVVRSAERKPRAVAAR